MKFTSEDLMKAMGLAVGDRVKYGVLVGVIAIDEDNEIIIEVYDKKDEYCGDSHLHELIGCEYKILPRPKRVGQLACREIKDCRTCPLQWLCFIKINEKDEMQTSLYEMLESFAVKDQEIYDLLKARLDKEVVEE